MKITEQQIRQIIKEEIKRVSEAPTTKPVPADVTEALVGASRRPAKEMGGLPTNAMAICKVLAKHGPLTKAEIVELMGKKAGAFAKSDYSIDSYFTNISPFSKAYSGNNVSLLAKRLVYVVGTEGTEKVYDLTDAGLEFCGG